MSSQDDVRAISLALANAVEDESSFAFRANGRLFVWAWLERVDPKKARVPSSEVVVVRVRDEMDKQTLLGLGDPAIFTSRISTAMRTCWSGSPMSIDHCSTG